jgi:hypothetical protein
MSDTQATLRTSVTLCRGFFRYFFNRRGAIIAMLLLGVGIMAISVSHYLGLMFMIVLRNKYGHASRMNEAKKEAEA